MRHRNQRGHALSERREYLNYLAKVRAEHKASYISAQSGFVSVASGIGIYGAMVAAIAAIAVAIMGIFG